MQEHEIKALEVAGKLYLEIAKLLTSGELTMRVAINQSRDYVELFLHNRYRSEKYITHRGVSFKHLLLMEQFKDFAPIVDEARSIVRQWQVHYNEWCLNLDRKFEADLKAWNPSILPVTYKPNDIEFIKTKAPITRPPQAEESV